MWSHVQWSVWLLKFTHLLRGTCCNSVHIWKRGKQIHTSNTCSDVGDDVAVASFEEEVIWVIMIQLDLYLNIFYFNTGWNVYVILVFARVV